MSCTEIPSTRLSLWPASPPAWLFYLIIPVKLHVDSQFQWQLSVWIFWQGQSSCTPQSSEWFLLSFSITSTYTASHRSYYIVIYSINTVSCTIQQSPLAIYTRELMFWTRQTSQQFLAPLQTWLHCDCWWCTSLLGIVKPRSSPRLQDIKVINQVS